MTRLETDESVCKGPFVKKAFLQGLAQRGVIGGRSPGMGQKVIITERLLVQDVFSVVLIHRRNVEGI